MPITLSGVDLVVESVTSSATELIAGRAVDVTWTVRNRGDRPAMQDWYDLVYFVSDDGTQKELIYSEYMGVQSPLDVGEPYIVTRSITLPNYLSAGSGRLVVETDGKLDSQNPTRQPEAVEANNSASSSPVTVRAADLIVTAATAPAELAVGTATELTWTISNDGTTPAVAPNVGWVDAIYLSSNTGELGTFLTTKSRTTELSAGGTYTQTASVTPERILPGNYFLVFVANAPVAGGSSRPTRPVVGETNARNNTWSVPVVVKAADLVVTNVIVPPGVNAGDEIDVTWTVRNAGTATALGGWTDSLSIGSSNASLPHTNPLLPGESYTAKPVSACRRTRRAGRSPWRFRPVGTSTPTPRPRTIRSSSPPASVRPTLSSPTSLFPTLWRLGNPTPSRGG